MSEDLLEDMEGNTGVGEPSGTGVSETVSGEIRQAEVSNDLVPAGRIANGGRREETATRTNEEWCVRLLERAESLQDRPEWRSVARRVGKEWVSTCRSRWSADH